MTILGIPLKIITYLSRATLLGITFAIVFFSLARTFPFGLSHADKLLHMGGYFTITLLAILSWPHSRRRIAILTLVFGLTLEVLQIFQPSRSFHFADLLANITGIIAAILVAWCAKKIIIKS